MGTVREELKEIRTQLRLAMNGVTSTSMREKGILYKLNFGVSYPEIKEIARTHEPNAELAAALWRQDIREFKILATFLQPVEGFTGNKFFRWVEQIPYLEIAESCCRNLFVHLPDVQLYTIILLLAEKDKFARTVVYLTWTELLKHGKVKNMGIMRNICVEGMHTLTSVKLGATWMEKQAAIQTLKFYGRHSEGQAAEILSGFDAYKERFEAEPELQEIYNDLKFEFDYYL